MPSKIQNLYQQQLKLVVSKLKSDYRPEKIILFGSAAQGKFRPDSDLDFFILKKTRRRFVDRVGEALGLLENLKVPVDLVVYTPEEFIQAKKENRMFIEEVLETGKILYEAP